MGGRNGLARLQPRSRPSTPQLEEVARVWRSLGTRSRLFPPPPPLELPGRPGGRARAPAPSPGGRRASDSGGGDGPRGKPGGWGRGAACTWPLSAAQAQQGRAWTPASPEGAAGEGSLPPRPGEVRHPPGRGNLPPGRSAGGDACGGRPARRPLPEPRWAGSPGRPLALSSGRKFQKLSIIPAQAARRRGCQGFPKESPHADRAAGRATARPALAPTQSHSARQPRSSPGRAGAGRAAPSRAPETAECVAAPAGGYFEREGSGPAAMVFGFFLAPVPLAGALGSPAEEGTRGREGEGRAASIPLRAGEGPGDTRPDWLARSAGRAAELLRPPDTAGGSEAPATCTPLLR